jgi:hypothetical protein
VGAYHNALITVLPSEARTQSVSSEDFENLHYRGVKVVVDVSDLSNMPGITVAIEGHDPVSGKYYEILKSASITAAGTTILTVYPGIEAVSNVSASDVLPRYWRVSVVHDNSDSITYSIGATMIL